jgi:two-component system NarL family response regulator
VSDPQIRILVTDDHPVVRDGLRSVIAHEADMTVVGEAENGQRAVELFRQLLPDVVLMDLRMPVMGGVDATRAITAEQPSARVLALTTYEGDADIFRALERPARAATCSRTCFSPRRSPPSARSTAERA